jgi:ABC-type uncharacterized transport system permease subunit
MLGIFSFLAIIAYLVTSILVFRQLNERRHGHRSSSRVLPLIFGFVGMACHFSTLALTTLTETGLDFGLYNMLSIIMWTICLLLMVGCLNRPLDHLGMIVLPLCCIAIILKYLNPETHHITNSSTKLEIHVMLSMLAYGIISLAAVQAILFAIQDHQLHNKHRVGLIRALPSLYNMESLLFKLIMLGFVTLTFSLASGFAFLENMFSQHVAHKTILSLITWAGFGILLFGHHRYGWRGKTATRITLLGAIILMLGYLGSKIVMEVILT